MTTSARRLRYALPLATVSWVLSACGSASPAPDDDAQARTGAGSGTDEPTAASGCDLDEPERWPLLASADLDGDGLEDAVRQSTPDDACPGELVVVVGDRVLTAGALDGPPATGAFVAELTDGNRLLVTRQDHPRGGFQSRLYAEASGGLVELTDGEGNALVPFVATDTVPGTPVSVRCADGGGVTVTEARVDPGDPTSLEIGRQTYRIEDSEAVAEHASPPSETVTAERLGQEYAELADNAVLEDCRAD